MKKHVSQNRFAMMPNINIQRSTFDRSHGYKTAFNSGYLIPFYVDEALPGDTFKLDVSIFGRLATPITPIMDNIWIDTFFFAVPNRLLWNHWEDFITQTGSTDTATKNNTDYLLPQVVLDNNIGEEIGSLADYFGIPPLATGLKVSALPFRAYNLIYNEWFRDENLIDEVEVNRDSDGPDSMDDYQLLRRGKRHDYFTSALPWPQKYGGDGVQLPLGNTAKVFGNGALQFDGVDAAGNIVRAGLQLREYEGNSFLKTSQFAANHAVGTTDTTLPNVKYQQWNQVLGVTSNPNKSGLVADLSEATAASINALREAFQMQRLFEKDRYGSRYTEVIRAHFNVKSPDARLQRPEYLGGSSTRMNINQVAQTSSTDDVSPQGNLSAFGVFGDLKHGFTKSFTEHCTIIGLVNVRADLTYQQGINRMWNRRTRFDFYWPTLAHLGEQEILNKEIYAYNTPEVNEQVFGYQERYSEYRYYPSMITGAMRSTAPQSLDVWHLSQDFADTPRLNQEFIEDNPPLGRVLAVQNQPQIIFDSYFNLKCTRPMPLYSVPGLVDHF